MTENHEKIDELLGKIKTLGNRAKAVRTSFGQPLADRVGTRLDKLLTRLPQHDGGDSNPRPQAPLKVCPRCGRPFFENVDFCNCGFSFGEEKRRQEREQIEGERVERNGRMGVIPP
jgi:hypothetical protein